MTSTLKRIGGSLAIVIPKSMADGFFAGQKIELTEQSGGILLKRPRTRARRPMDDLVKQMDPAAYSKHAKTFLSDPPVGKEVW